MRVAPSGICLTASLPRQCCAVITRKLINLVPLHLLTGGNSLLDLTRALCVTLKHNNWCLMHLFLSFRVFVGVFLFLHLSRHSFLSIQECVWCKYSKYRFSWLKFGRISAAPSKLYLWWGVGGCPGEGRLMKAPLGFHATPSFWKVWHLGVSVAPLPLLKSYHTFPLSSQGYLQVIFF